MTYIRERGNFVGFGNGKSYTVRCRKCHDGVLRGLEMLSTRSALVVTVAFTLTLGTWDPALAGLAFAAPQAGTSQGPESAIVAAVKRALSGQSDLRRLAVSADGSQVTLTGRVPT